MQPIQLFNKQTRYAIPARIFVFFMLSCLIVRGQSSENFTNSYINVDKYKKVVLSPEFGLVFKTTSEKENFKRLREFLSEKNELYSVIISERSRYYVDDRSIQFFQDRVAALNNLMEGKKDEEIIEVDRNEILNSPYSNYDSASLIKDKFKIGYIRKLRNNYATNLSELKTNALTLSILDSNINNVRDDIRAMYRQFDSTLAPEYKQQDFRKSISLYFTFLIAVLLVTFFVIVYKRSDSSLSKDLLSGNGLQFVTLFVLIIAVILFGILSILGSSELAAILSGISGYILGKGTQKDLATMVSNNPNVATGGGQVAQQGAA